MHLLGIFGHPIAHSLSPKMQNAAIREAGLEKDFFYLPFDILPENIGKAIDSIRVLGIKGVNVTIPHKEAVIPYLDSLDAQAKGVQAVNVIINRNGKLTGYNTDGIGFIRALREDAGIDPEEKKVVILGAGGAAKAISAALASAGARKLVIVNRTIKRALIIREMLIAMGLNNIEVIVSDFDPEELQKEFLKEKLKDDLKEEISSAQIIVNTTSVGLYPHNQSLLTDYQDCLNQNQLVTDIIYHPGETLLLKQARLRGCATLSGEGMLVYQGAEAFKLWTGVEAPVNVMRKVLREELKNVE